MEKCPTNLIPIRSMDPKYFETSGDVKKSPSSLYEGGYIDNGLMLLAPGAFIILGLIIWLQRTYTGYVEE